MSSAPPDATRPPGRLVLADGTIFIGRAFGAVGRGLAVQAEVVFNTALTGYQESLTDPSYTGQILVQTATQVGNTGTNPEDVESRKVQVAGFVVRELAPRPSNFRADEGLPSYLARHGVLGLEGVDTRAITKRLRTAGSVSGVLTDRADLSDDQLRQMARSAPSMAGQNLVPLVGCSSRQSWSETLGDWSPRRDGADATFRPRVLALDCGAKRNILRHLTDRGCDVVVMPHSTDAARIRQMYDAGEIDGLFISNGPGDPAAVGRTIQTLRETVVSDPAIPTFGICLGHQLLALAVGAKTFKLKFGHRGTNQPVFNRESGRVEITSQNHGFAVDPKSLEAVGGQATHVHLNDGTLAGFRLPDRPVFSVQYHPEASPGPHDSAYLFDEFVRSMAAHRRSVGQRATAERV
ncbi:MAG: glutamine-hydrolyzing carbamoyl-phosphate synthase small subunit [Phycisphaerae bacterium]|nr:glutamine-hydrolyzing carbamoyl-phosphate synthase small subunit [Phycisphaerae bacterium]